MDINTFFTELEKLLKQAGLQTAVIKGQEPQIGNTLRTLLPVSDDGEIVLTEFMAAPFTEDANILQIYTALIPEIGPGYEALKEMTLDWNLTCSLGAFGIYREGRQFYHKYNYPMPLDVPPDEMALEIFYLVNLIRDAVMQVYPDAVRLSGNL